MIVTFTDRFPGAALRDHAARFPSSVGDLSLPAEGVALKASTAARVNVGRWIADCPQNGCGGAELVNFDDPRFFCCECRNAGFQGLPVKVEIPTPKLRNSIEELLLARPVPATRNWTPDETVKQLKIENEEHGI